MFEISAFATETRHGPGAVVSRGDAAVARSVVAQSMPPAELIDAAIPPFVSRNSPKLASCRSKSTRPCVSASVSIAVNGAWPPDALIDS